MKGSGSEVQEEYLGDGDVSSCGTVSGELGPQLRLTNHRALLPAHFVSLPGPALSECEKGNPCSWALPVS